ncbi:hypothetical protein GTE93_12025 [Roseobacter sp. HKCCD7103]|nr:hypothetical protein [Roseobacter sp. HKCCD7103]
MSKEIVVPPSLMRNCARFNVAPASTTKVCPYAAVFGKPQLANVLVSLANVEMVSACAKPDTSAAMDVKVVN